jgi:hypothetical protein
VRTFRDLIRLWPSRAVFAREMGIGYEAAAAMYGRSFIHPHHWERLLDAAARRRIKVSPKDLISMSDKRRRRRNRPARGDARAAA